MLEHTVVVKLAKILDFSNTPLIKSIIVLLKAKSHRFDHVIDNPDHEGGMVPIERAEQDSKKMNTPIFDLSRL